MAYSKQWYNTDHHDQVVLLDHVRLKVSTECLCADYCFLYKKREV